MQETTHQPAPLPEEQPSHALASDEWYKTREGRFVRILYKDLDLGKFVAQLDARELCYDATGKAYYVTPSGVHEAPGIYHLQDLTPVPEPPVREYMMHIHIDATVLMRGRSVQEVMALAPDLIDLESLDRDIQVRNFHIRVGSGHLVQSQ